MDPYLEHPDLWPGVHNALIAAMQRALAPAVRPGYVVRLEERTYLNEPDDLVFIGRPDVGVHRHRDADPEAPASSTPDPVAVSVRVPVPDHVRETWLEVRSAASGEVVTVVELLSPSNKRRGSRGRRRYEAKRMAVLGTRTHLVEIDLIRDGEPMAFHGTDRRSDYRLLISRGDRRPNAQAWLFSVREPIPTFRLPLRRGDAEPEVDVGALLRELYETLGYDASVDYRADAVPPLADDDRAWADAVPRAAGRR
jgi:hypothetical protein